MAVKSFIPALAVIAAALVAPAHAAEPIRIGVPIGLSGANSVVAPSVVQSAELAVEEINAAGASWGARSSSWLPTTAAAPPARRRPSIR